MPSIPIPEWEVQQLNSLQNQGALMGVSADQLAVMSLAESGGQGSTYTNSSGYGGYFGLSRSDMTMYGQNPNLLTEQGIQPLDAQARVAADIFSGLEKRAGGNPYEAEVMYQGGSTEGETLMREYGIAGNFVGKKGTVPTPNNKKTAAQVTKSNDKNLSGDTMQTEIFNSLQNQNMIGIGPIKFADPLMTPIDWIIAQVIPILLGLAIFLIALVVLWHILDKDMGGKLNRAAGSVARKGMEAAALA